MFKRYVYCEGLTSLLGSTGKYLINIDGQIKDIKGNDLPFYRDEEGHRVVHCSGWDGERDYRVIDLVAVQFKGLYVPSSYFNEIRAFVIDGDKDNVHAVNVGYRFKCGKIEFAPFPGFYYVPGMTSIAVSEDGRVVSTITAEEKKLGTTKPNQAKNIKGGYRTVTASIKGNKSHSAGRHRALCLTFKEFPDNVDSMTVNHKNGVPGDDRLDNLEWVTRGENNKHAYVNDLKKQHIRVLLRDVLSGEVNEHYSISEAGRVVGIRSGTMYDRIFRSPFGTVFYDGTQVKLKTDTRDWVIPADPEQAIKDARFKIPIVARNCKTLEEHCFESTSHAGSVLDINPSSISFRFKVNNRSPLFGYQFKLADDTTPWEAFTEEEYQLSLKPNSFEVDARNLLTGETKTFASIRKAREEFGYLSVTDCPEGKEQPLLGSGWQFKRREDAWEEVPDFEETIYKLKREVMCKNEETGEVIIADTALQMSEILHLDPKAIRRAAYTRGHALFYQYRFRLGISDDPWPDTKVSFLKRHKKNHALKHVML